MSYGICFGLMYKFTWVTDKLRAIPIFKDENGDGFFARMLNCPYCTGFHSGYIAWVLVYTPTTISWGCAREAIVMGFASATCCYVIDTIIEYMG